MVRRLKKDTVRPTVWTTVAPRFQIPISLPYRPSFRQRCLTSTALSGLVLISGMTGLSHANPTGGNVVAGGATIAQPSSAVTEVTQTTNRAIINWNSFSINTGERTQFYQPSASSWVLNRVTGGDPSRIAGQLVANGNVAISNASGVVFAKGAQVDVNGLIATTADIHNEDFMAGKFNFNIPSSNPNATVTNDGQISIADHGLAALVAPGVANSGIIHAKFGKVTLAGAQTFTVDFYGDGLISFDVGSKVTQGPLGPDGQPVSALVTNTGQIQADGGTILLTADAVDNIVTDIVHAGGVLQAHSVGAQTGRVMIEGGNSAGSTVLVSGVIDASGRNAGETGGTVNVRGDRVGVLSSATIDVSGQSGGGNVAIGGTFHGAGGHNAAATVVQKGATIYANAITKGDGGKIAIWSNRYTSFEGSVYARGGRNGGNGGYLETSSAGNLSVGSGSVVDLRSYSGKAGLWLLDPSNLEVVHADDGTGGRDGNIDTAGGTLSFVDGGANDTISDSAINAGLAKADVVLQAQNDIKVDGTADTGTAIDGATVENGAVQINSTSSNSLTLQAGRSVTINSGASITLKGNFTAVADDSSAGDTGNRGGGAGDLTMTGATINTSSGATSVVTLTDTAGTTVGGTIYTAGAIALGSITAGANGTLTVNGGATGISQTSADTLTNGGASSFSTTANNATIGLAHSTNALTGGVTFNTAGTTGNVALKNSGGTALAASTVNGSLAVEDATGSISQTGALTITGTSSFATDANAATIALNTQSNALTGAVSLETMGAGGDASLKNGVAGTGTVLGVSAVGGNLSIEETTAGISQTGAVHVTGTSRFQMDTAGQTIDLSTATNALGGAIQAIAFVTNGSGNTVKLLNSGGTLLAGTTINGSLSVEDTTGNISQAGALAITNGSSFTTDGAGASINLASATNALGISVSLITGGATGSTASLKNSGGTILATSTVGDTLTVEDTTAGISQSGALTVQDVSGGTSGFRTDATGQAITLTNNGNRLAGAVTFTTDNGNAALVDSVPLTVAGGTVGTGMLLLMAPGVTITGLVDQ